MSGMFKEPDNQEVPLPVYTDVVMEQYIEKLRDTLAIEAFKSGIRCGLDLDRLSEWAYAAADAMMNARSKTGATK